MTDIDAMCANLNQQECCKSMGGPGVHPPGCGKCPRDIAAALERMRDERDAHIRGSTNAAQQAAKAVFEKRAAEAEVVRLREALTKCRDYIISPLRMTKDEDEHKRRQDIIYDATEALAQRSK